MKLMIDISKDRYDEIMLMDWKNCRRFFDEEIRAIHDGTLFKECEDAISRQAAIDAMFALCDTGETLKENPWRDNPHIDAVTETIERLPPVNPQHTEAEIQKMQELEQAEIQKAYELGKAEDPKTGHWIDIMVGDMPAQACDQCNTFYPLAYTGGWHNYCPNCGIKMIRPQERNDKE